MRTLIYSGCATGLALAALIIYMIWFGSTAIAGKLLLTLIILLGVEVVAYLILHDVKDEMSGKKDGTIAR